VGGLDSEDGQRLVEEFGRELRDSMDRAKTAATNEQGADKSKGRSRTRKRPAGEAGIWGVRPKRSRSKAARVVPLPPVIPCNYSAPAADAGNIVESNQVAAAGWIILAAATAAATADSVAAASVTAAAPACAASSTVAAPAARAASSATARLRQASKKSVFSAPIPAPNPSFAHAHAASGGVTGGGSASGGVPGGRAASEGVTCVRACPVAGRAMGV
jgi:hypothetical protein